MSLFARKPLETSDTPAFEQIPRHDRLERWILRLRRRAPISDSAFDEIFPPWIQELSRVHWTPIEVVRRATELLVGDRLGTRVLDVGSGAGKFCLVGSLVSKGRFFGIEQREHFVSLARALIAHYQIPRVTFLQGDFQDLDWRQFDAIYLFNPFQENKTPEQRLDSTVPLSREIYRIYVMATAKKLAEMPIGTRVVTYHGFGGAFPASYTREISEWCYRGPLEYWVKFR